MKPSFKTACSVSSQIIVAFKTNLVMVLVRGDFSFTILEASITETFAKTIELWHNRSKTIVASPL